LSSPVAPSLPWRDPLFYLALLAGPVSWLTLLFILQPAIQWGWPLHDRISSRSFGPLSVANLLTSVLFTALHFIYHAPAWAALVFLPSLVFGFFKDRTGGLTAPILLHVFYNAGFLWLFTTSA
jgi:membrane protease YdiL (CAAX protease family)